MSACACRQLLPAERCLPVGASPSAGCCGSHGCSPAPRLAHPPWIRQLLAYPRGNMQQPATHIAVYLAVAEGDQQAFNLQVRPELPQDRGAVPAASRRAVGLQALPAPAAAACAALLRAALLPASLPAWPLAAALPAARLCSCPLPRLPSAPLSSRCRCWRRRAAQEGMWSRARATRSRPASLTLVRLFGGVRHACRIRGVLRAGRRARLPRKPAGSAVAGAAGGRVPPPTTASCPAPLQHRAVRLRGCWP